MRYAALVTLLFSFTVACDFVGLCPSDLCVVDDDCPLDHVCGAGQCLRPCTYMSDCPVETVRCYDPQNRLGYTVCADADGVPGQVCDPEVGKGDQEQRPPA